MSLKFVSKNGYIEYKYPATNFGFRNVNPDGVVNRNCGMIWPRGDVPSLTDEVSAIMFPHLMRSRPWERGTQR